MIKPTKLHTAEHSVVVYHHCPEEGVTLADVIKSDYWTHVAPQLRIGHRIEIMAPDGAWWAMLLVRAVGRHEAVVQALQHVVLGQAAEVSPADVPYEIKWRGPARQFGVIRKSDGEVIKDQFAVREHAALWLTNHMRSMAA